MVRRLCPIVTHEAIVLNRTALGGVRIDSTLPTFASFLPFTIVRTLSICKNTCISHQRITDQTTIHGDHRCGPDSHLSLRIHDMLLRLRLGHRKGHDRQQRLLVQLMVLSLLLDRNCRQLTRLLLLPLRPGPLTCQLHQLRLLLHRRIHRRGHRRQWGELVRSGVRQVRREARLTRRILKWQERRRPDRRTQLAGSPGRSTTDQGLEVPGLQLARPPPRSRRRKRKRRHGSRRTAPPITGGRRARMARHGAGRIRNDCRE